MKQYVIDQLREEDHDKIEEFLKKNGEETVFSEVFRMLLPEDLYTDLQKEHVKCHPLYFAVNLSFSKVSFELLIRSREVLRCNCIGYADRRQLDYIIDFADHMLEDLKIRI